MNVESILKSFIQPEDKLFVRKVLDQAALCLKNHTHTFTNFIDMHQYGQMMKIITQIHPDLSYKIFGGYEEAERKMIGFSPFYLELENTDFPIQGLKIVNRSSNHHSLTHRDYLGALMQTGIEREKMGDILVTEDRAALLVDEKVATYIQMNLSKIGRATVEIYPLTVENLEPPIPEIKEIHTSVASLRVDAVLSSGFPISRGKAVDYIKAQKVFKNWVLVDSPSEPVEANDIITLRGFGRIKLVYIGNKTRKNRMSVIIHRYI
mgnify:CR=1 FL=1